MTCYIIYYWAIKFSIFISHSSSNSQPGKLEITSNKERILTIGGSIAHDQLCVLSIEVRDDLASRRDLQMGGVLIIDDLSSIR